MTITAADPGAGLGASDDSRAILHIDIAAVRANWRRFAALGNSGATVKADSYGLGMAPIARALLRDGCRDFFVAQAHEGVALRATLGPTEDGNGPRITVFGGPTPGTVALFRQHDLRPVLNSMAQIALWRDAGGGDWALHIDTGMNRLGLDATEAQTLAASGAAPNLSLVMSHLACADTPDHAMNAAQLARFRTLTALFPGVPRSLANSAGALLSEDYRFDVMRPGIGLYGGRPTALPDPALRPVATIMAPVIAVRRVRAGETIGYGGAYAAPHDMSVAVVGIGYADGMLRAVSPGGYGVLAGRRIPLVGRVSMDLIALDVTGLEAEAAPGAHIAFLGDALDDMAAAAGTISYEFLTRLGARFARRWTE